MVVPWLAMVTRLTCNDTNFAPEDLTLASPCYAASTENTDPEYIGLCLVCLLYWKVGFWRETISHLFSQ